MSTDLRYDNHTWSKKWTRHLLCKFRILLHAPLQACISRYDRNWYRQNTFIYISCIRLSAIFELYCVITRVNNIYFQPVSFLLVCNGETKRKLQKAIYLSNCWEMEHRCFFSCTRLFVCFESKYFYSFILSRSANNSFYISAFDSQMFCRICCHKCDRSSYQISWSPPYMIQQNIGVEFTEKEWT